MTNKEKKIIFTIVLIMIVILITIFCIKLSKNNNRNENMEGGIQSSNQNEEKYTEILNDGTKINSSAEFNKNKKYKKLSISNIQFTSKNGNSALIANVKNDGDTDFKMEEVTIVLLDEKGEEVQKIPVLLPGVKAGETKQLNSLITADVTNVKDFRIDSAK